MTRVVPALLLLVVLAWSPSVVADTIAASLYDEGVALLGEKKFEQACEKLDASFKREALSGTLMVLAQCHELRGLTATAWDEYQRAAGLAANEGRGEYEKKAKELAAKIEPKLSRLKLELAPGVTTEGLTVTVAGKPIDLATLGVALALDPGDYEIAVSAPGFESWSTTKAVNEPGVTVTVIVPVLERGAPEPVVAHPSPDPPPATVAPAPNPAPLPRPRQPDAGDGSVPTWAWIVGAAGVVMGGVAVGFLLDDLDAISELRDRCEADPNGAADDYLCDSGYDVDADNARKNRSGALALGFGIGAAVALTASIIGIATAPDDTADARLRVVPAAGSNGGGLLVEGRF